LHSQLNECSVFIGKILITCAKIIAVSLGTDAGVGNGKFFAANYTKTLKILAKMIILKFLGP